MDVSKAKRIITPAGELKRILSGGVVIWKKASAPKYGVYKDDVLVEEVTMDDFVDKVDSGYAEENWGIGAQLRVPYTDAWDEITYTLPWVFVHFDSFTVSGVTRRRIYLQAHYAVPSLAVPYRLDTSKTQNTNNFREVIRNSEAYKWLQSNDEKFISTITTYNGKKGFKACLPQDFSKRAAANIGPIPSAYMCYASHDNVYQTSSYHSDFYYFSTGAVQTLYLTFWENKIGTIQAFRTTNSNRVVYSLTGSITNVATSTIMTHCQQQTSLSKPKYTYYATYFSADGIYFYGSINGSYRYQPLFTVSKPI